MLTKENNEAIKTTDILNSLGRLGQIDLQFNVDIRFGDVHGALAVDAILSEISRALARLVLDDTFEEGAQVRVRAERWRE